MRFLQKAARCFGGWVVAVFFVTLLSFIFSFLGTMFCAAVAGMMLGATRQARVLAPFTSVIFPGVLFTLMRANKTDLPLGKEIALAVACFGAFWIVFGLSALFCSGEPKPAAAKAAANPRNPPPSAPARPEPVAPPAAAGLADLQGRWLEDAATTTARVQRKVLEIQRGNLELSVMGGDGHRNLLIRGRVILEPPGSSPG